MTSSIKKHWETGYASASHADLHQLG